MLVADQVSKALVVAHLQGEQPVEILGGLATLRYTANTGAAFSLLPQATLVFTLIAVVVCVVIVRTARTLISTSWAISLGLILGGALGNLVDRVFRPPGPGRGGVVDWIDLGWWPVFNIADVAIVSGAVLVAVLIFRGVHPDQPRDDGQPRTDEADDSAADGG